MARGEVEIGVLAGEADNGELIHIHRCSPQIEFVVPSVLGHRKASGPAPKRGECFVGGPPCRMRFEAGAGEPRKQNVAERRARGFKRSSAQDRKGDRDRRRTESHERAHLSDEADQDVSVANPRTRRDRTHR
jgi:hypothetical protein